MTARRMTLTSWHRGWIATGSSDGGNTVETLWRILPGYDCRTYHSPRMKRIEFETSHNPKRLRVAPKICDHPVIKRGNSIMTLSDWQKLPLYRFTVYPACIIWFPLQNGCRNTSYTSTSTASRFLLQRWNCMVWYDTCECNCISQLHRPFSSSERSFEFSMLEEVRMSSHSMLQAFHWPASA